MMKNCCTKSKTFGPALGVGFKSLFTCAMAFAVSFGQAATNPKSSPVSSPPVAHERVEAKQSVLLPAFSPAQWDALQKKEASNLKGRLQIGTGRSFDKPIVVNSKNIAASDWTTLADGSHAWALSVTSQGALGIRLHLENISLPAGARLLVYDPANPNNAQNSLTPDTLGGRADAWTGTIYSDQVTLECDVPSGADTAAVQFTVAELSHLYLLPVNTSTLKEGTCHNDVTCFPAYATDATAVARMSFIDGGSSFLCTGCLLAVNSTNSDSALNSFLTANHCIPNQTLASTAEFYWLYQTSTCNGAPPALTNVPHTTGGADILAGSSASDFTFMRLRQSAPDGITPLNWSTNAPSAGDAMVCIHHPTGAYKRISFGKFINSTPNYWAVQWNSGVTEPGSSGSPLLDSSHSVIGQLNGGFNGPGSSCANPSAADQFGRFDITYGSIKQWLAGAGGTGGGTAVPNRGNYNGLFSDQSAEVSQQSAGAITVNVAGASRFSGRLQMPSGRYGFHGQFDSSGNASVKIARGLFKPLTMQLSGDAGQDGDRIVGTVSDGTWTAEVEANRDIFESRGSVSPEAGQYTIVIPGNGNSPTNPAGDSFATVVVDNGGHVRMSGTLADGTRMSQTTSVSKDGRWGVFVPLYGGQGMVWGWVTFESTDSSDLDGSVSWLKLRAFNTRLFKSGFVVDSTLVGSRYTRPPRGGTVLNASTLNLVLQGGGLNEPITTQIGLGGGRVTDLGGSKLVMSFSPSTGTFTGRLLDAQSFAPITFRGAVLQKQNSGSGFFLSTSQTGEVLLQP